MFALFEGGGIRFHFFSKIARDDTLSRGTQSGHTRAHLTRCLEALLEYASRTLNILSCDIRLCNATSQGVSIVIFLQFWAPRLRSHLRRRVPSAARRVREHFHGQEEFLPHTAGVFRSLELNVRCIPEFAWKIFPCLFVGCCIELRDYIIHSKEMPRFRDEALTKLRNEI